MRFFLLIIFTGILCQQAAVGQVQRRTYHDAAEEKLREEYFVRDTISNILEGPYKSFYLNGEPESRGQFENNEATGIWEFFYETGLLRIRARVKAGYGNDGYYEYFYEGGEKSMEGFVTGQKQSGKWKFYYESGTLREEGSFTDGVRHGEWRSYFEDGILSSVSIYEHGDGRRKEYFPSGTLKAEGPVKGKVKSGYWTYYDKEGRKIAEGSFSGDQRSGEWVYYHGNGKVSSRGAYEDNIAVGLWDYYDYDGNISSRGAFSNGEKEGNWEIFYPSGELKGKAMFENGNGPYREYYASGALRAEGQIQGGLSEGEWKYYFEDGSIEGICTFDGGRGTYTGYYPDGTIQTRGTIENNRRVGRWELFSRSGELTGYYTPIYQGEEIINLPDLPRETRPQNYGVADYKFKGSRKGYFDRGLNEFNGVIVEANPLLTLIGRFPVSLEIYMEERMGYQLSLTGIRDPFFKKDGDIALNETFRRGYQVAVQQRFYNPAGFGLWYFGHELRFSDLQHYSRIELNPGEIDKVAASEYRLDYSAILGYRIMGDTQGQGFTIDTYISAGAGFRSFNDNGLDPAVFSSVDQDKVSFRFGFGLMAGYVFPYNNQRRR